MTRATPRLHPSAHRRPLFPWPHPRNAEMVALRTLGQFFAHFPWLKIVIFVLPNLAFKFKDEEAWIMSTTEISLHLAWISWAKV